MLAILRWPKEAVLSFNESWFWSGQDLRASAALAARARLPLQIIRRPTFCQRYWSALQSRKSCAWVAVLLVGAGLQWPVPLVQADGQPANWAPPIEPPGTVVVTHHSAAHLATRYKIQPPLSVPDGLQKVADTVPPLSNGVIPPRAAAANNEDAANVKTADASAPPATLPSPSKSMPSEPTLQQAVQQWSRAWSQQNVPAYLAMYAPSFEPPKGMTRQTWAQQRSQRIQSKKRIQHEVREPVVSLTASNATVRFEQLYADERLQQRDQKTLHWVWQDGLWRITRESTH